MNAKFIVATLIVMQSSLHAESAWKLEEKSALGPIAQVTLPSNGAKHRTALVVFEYARKCDPIFSFAEISGSKLGAPISQSRLDDSKIGVFVNGNFHTWGSGITKYDNGFEVGFGITNQLYALLIGRVDSLVYLTPSGERVSMPTSGLNKSIQDAANICIKRFQ